MKNKFRLLNMLIKNYYVNYLFYIQITISLRKSRVLRSDLDVFILSNSPNRPPLIFFNLTLNCKIIPVKISYSRKNLREFFYNVIFSTLSISKWLYYSGYYLINLLPASSGFCFQCQCLRKTNFRHSKYKLA